MGVAPLLLVACVAAPFFGDADAADEPELFVDYEYLAVASVVVFERGLEPGLAEPLHVHPGRVHPVDQALFDL